MSDKELGAAAPSDRERSGPTSCFQVVPRQVSGLGREKSGKTPGVRSYIVSEVSNSDQVNHYG